MKAFAIPVTQTMEDAGRGSQKAAKTAVDLLMSVGLGSTLCFRSSRSCCSSPALLLPSGNSLTRYQQLDHKQKPLPTPPKDKLKPYTYQIFPWGE